jgi:hypothetical protein
MYGHTILAGMAKQRREKKRQTGPDFTTTVTLPRDLYDRVRIAAIREHVTFREYMQRALRAALARKECMSA